LFSSNFYEWVEGGLTYYVHKTNHSYNFTFEGQGKWGPIKSVLTLEPDFVTIKKVVVCEQTEQWGAKIQTDPALLAALTGLKLSTPIEAFDGMAGATETMNGFLTSLNESYAAYYELLILNPMKKAMLANNNIAFTDANFESLFDSSFEVTTSNGLVLYTTKSTGALNFLVESERSEEHTSELQSRENL